MARCPARDHEDREASLSIARGTEQPVVFKCHANCDRDAILDGLGLTLADVSKPREQHDGGAGWTPAGPATAVYDYTDEHGTLLFQVCRTAGKQFPQRRPDPSAKSGWAWKLGRTRRVPYRLPELIAAVTAGRLVYIAEGEKDVHAIQAAGGDVIIIADRDEPGRRHARTVEEHLRPVARGVAVFEAAEGKDAADHLAAGYSLAEFVP